MKIAGTCTYESFVEFNSVAELNFSFPFEYAFKTSKVCCKAALLGIKTLEMYSTVYLSRFGNVLLCFWVILWRFFFPTAVAHDFHITSKLLLLYGYWTDKNMPFIHKYFHKCYKTIIPLKHVFIWEQNDQNDAFLQPKVTI